MDIKEIIALTAPILGAAGLGSILTLIVGKMFSREQDRLEHLESVINLQATIINTLTERIRTLELEGAELRKKVEQCLGR